MCECHPDFKQADEGGQLLRAIELADLPCPRRQCNSARRARWLKQFALRCPLKRDLCGKAEHKQILLGWFVAARVEIPDVIERLWRPDGEIGVARFCTVRQGTTEGHLHRLCVGPAEQANQAHKLRADDAFWAAISRARQFVVNQLGGSPASERVQAATIEVDSTEDEFSDQSVALAALVAFWSLALRLPVAPHLIFSGVLDGTDVKPPARVSLPHKLDAVLAGGAHLRLVVPTGSARFLPLEKVSSVVIECHWRGALEVGLGHPFTELEREARQHHLQHPATPDSVVSEVLRDAVFACLQAVGDRGADIDLLDRCFRELRRTDPDIPASSGAFWNELSRLKRTGTAHDEDQRWRLTSTAGLASPVLRRQALGALATALESQGNRQDSLIPRLKLGQVDEAARSLEALLLEGGADERQTRLAPATALLFEAARSDRELSSPLRQALAKATRLPSRLLRVALHCSEQPVPYSSFFESWKACQGAIDRLFWLQSVAEFTLHLLVVLALPQASAPPDEPPAGALSDPPLTGEVPDPERSRLREDFQKRPSIGNMAKLLLKLAPRPAGVLASQKAADRMAGEWNGLLHHVGAWRQLAGMDSDALETQLDQLAAGVLDLLEGLHQVGGAALVQQVAGEADRDARLVIAGDSWLLRRGLLDGKPRYWSFDRLRPEQPLAHPQPRALPTLKELNSPIDRLPTPLTLALLDLKRGEPLVLRHLALLDEATHWLLRLAIPEVAVLNAASIRAGGGHPRHKRSLLEAIQHDQSPHAFLGDYLRAAPGRDLAFELIGVLERLEHAPGPLSGWGDLLTFATGLLGALLQASSWVQDTKTDRALTLLALPPTPWSFMGRPRRPTKGPATLPAEVWIQRGQDRILCGDWLGVAGGPDGPVVQLTEPLRPVKSAPLPAKSGQRADAKERLSG